MFSGEVGLGGWISRKCALFNAAVRSCKSAPCSVCLCTRSIRYQKSWTAGEWPSTLDCPWSSTNEIHWLCVFCYSLHRFCIDYIWNILFFMFNFDFKFFQIFSLTTNKIPMDYKFLCNEKRTKVCANCKCDFLALKMCNACGSEATLLLYRYLHIASNITAALIG